MLGILFIIVITLYLAFLYPILKPAAVAEESNPKQDVQVRRLWSIAQASMRERKTLRAEKALLAILKMDEKNAAAYNRLGILYAKEQKYDEAIECFEIAGSLDDNASSLHNMGLIYLETGAYEKAAIAFEQALKMEGDLPARYTALARAYEKLGRRKDAIDALEAAYELDHSVATLRHILTIHEESGDTESAEETTARIESQIAKNRKIEEVAAKRRSRLGRSDVRMRTSSAMRAATSRSKRKMV
ncbi:tetratricopeptide repeat protein [Candidatus Saccharibacteria bacterium]|nr:tetratricopeptide repeat protein [Candidatus Saccharibacteria bacterium]